MQEKFEQKQPDKPSKEGSSYSQIVLEIFKKGFEKIGEAQDINTQVKTLLDKEGRMMRELADLCTEYEKLDAEVALTREEMRLRDELNEKIEKINKEMEELEDGMEILLNKQRELNSIPKELTDKIDVLKRNINLKYPSKN